MRLIIADDNYAERLAETVRTNFSDVEVITTTTAKEAIEAMDIAISEGAKTAVLSDFYLPFTAADEGVDSGLQVFAEICEYYGVNKACMESILRRIGVIYATTADDEDRRISQILINAHKAGVFDPLRSVRLESECFPEDVRWAFGVCFAGGFKYTRAMGLPMGIRIAQEAAQRGLPFVVISGDHGDAPLPVVAAYLRDNGVIESAKVGDTAEKNVDKISVFVACKDPDSYQSKYTDNLLIKIVTSLIERTQ